MPFIRPYRVRADIQSWFGDPVIFDLVQDEFKRGYYRGIGEFHLSGKSAENEWVKKTVDFAVANDLYLHAHADDEAVEILMRHNPKARIIWAHTGFGLSTDRVSAMLSKYPKLWGELSYRGGITDGAGKLTPEWRGLFERYPDRFLLGSDTWINERWASYGDIMAATAPGSTSYRPRSPRKSRTAMRGRCSPRNALSGRNRQIEKLVPQPQEAVAFGLTTRNEAPIRSSTKSTSEPARNGTEAGSTSTTAPSRAITRSSSAWACSTSNLY